MIHDHSDHGRNEPMNPYIQGKIINVGKCIRKLTINLPQFLQLCQNSQAAIPFTPSPSSVYFDTTGISCTVNGNVFQIWSMQADHKGLLGDLGQSEMELYF